MEFELEDYRSGRIKKKVRNLNCVNSTGYNTNKGDNNVIYNNKTKKDLEKSIYVNNSKSNNYLISKLKKENESLRLMLSEYETNIIKYQISQKLIRYQKMDNNSRLGRKTTGSKNQSITKNMSNVSNYGNNTYTTNFYRTKNSKKYNTNNNSLLINNKSNEFHNAITSKIPSVNSYVIHNKKIVKRRSKQSLSVFRSLSKNKSKSKPKDKNKNIYDKVKTNYKKIPNNVNKNTNENATDIKIKEKKTELNNSNNNMNMSHSRLYTLNDNNVGSKNVFTYKKKLSKNTEKIMKNNNNICNTERKKLDGNISNFNSNTENLKNVPSINKLDRNTCAFMKNNEFNLTWSKFPKKEEEQSFDNNLTEANPAPQSSITSSKNISKVENRKNRKYITKVSSKHKNSIDKFDNYRLKPKKDLNQQKITINKKIIANKMKNNNNSLSSNNVSMKSVFNLHQKNKKASFDDNKNLCPNSINTSASNKMIGIHNNILHEGEIYSNKKKDSLIGNNYKTSNINENTNEIIYKKNSMNSLTNKYNVTINNINNCNYFNLIQGTNNKPEIKIIKKRVNKNN
jgi:hypothetical protein